MPQQAALTAAREYDEASERTLHLVVAINVLGLSIALAAAVWQWGVWSAYACTGFASALYVSRLRSRRHGLRTHLLLFGLTAGVIALAADWWLVSVYGTLTYNPWGPTVLDSPLYMPLSWAGITMTIGFAGCVIARRHGRAVAVLAATAIAGLLVPTYEILAGDAGWWSYAEPHLIGRVPWCIVLAGALIGPPLPMLVERVLARLDARTSIVHGCLAGLCIGAAYVVCSVVCAGAM